MGVGLAGSGSGWGQSPEGAGVWMGRGLAGGGVWGQSLAGGGVWLGGEVWLGVTSSRGCVAKGTCLPGRVILVDSEISLES